MQVYIWESRSQENRAKVIPIYNKEGKQISTMEETIKAKETFMYEKLNGCDDVRTTLYSH